MQRSKLRKWCLAPKQEGAWQLKKWCLAPMQKALRKVVPGTYTGAPKQDSSRIAAWHLCSAAPKQGSSRIAAWHLCSAAQEVVPGTYAAAPMQQAPGRQKRGAWHLPRRSRPPTLRLLVNSLHARPGRDPLSSTLIRWTSSSHDPTALRARRGRRSSRRRPYSG